MSAGTLSLLRSQTTKPLISPADLATVPELQSLINAKWPRLTNRPWGIPNSWIKATAPQQPKGDPASTAIIQAIGSNVLSADTLATKVDIPAGLLAAKLIELELLGMIIKLPDGTYMSTQNTTPKDP
jgi:predicted Rossmann fold nucleotide-binding protein DprA/Smf involved in DNA uptake